MLIRLAFPSFFALLLIAGITAPAFAETDTLLSRNGDWEAHRLERDGKMTCYAIAKPNKSTPKFSKRDSAYFMITDWPDRDSKAEPSIVAGYAYREGSNVAVTVGKSKFSFFTKGDGAWLASEQDEKRLLSAMRKTGSVTVKGTSSRGTSTTDWYSLSGLSRALDKIAKACK
jgi:hypothetical protein